MARDVDEFYGPVRPQRGPIQRALEPTSTERGARPAPP
jgi:hypothetical protein